MLIYKIRSAPTIDINYIGGKIGKREVVVFGAPTTMAYIGLPVLLENHSTKTHICPALKRAHMHSYSTLCYLFLRTQASFLFLVRITLLQYRYGTLGYLFLCAKGHTLAVHYATDF